jgi:hypothetical protein
MPTHRVRAAAMLLAFAVVPAMLFAWPAFV